jgi:chromosome partitioning protein
MPVVAIVNQKGGTGKTTLATNLAWVLAEKGEVLLLDADPQASAQNWAASDDPAPEALTVKGAGRADLLRLVHSMAADYEWVIIDGPPGITKTSADAVRVADVVLIPAKPSPLDVWAAADIVAAVQARQKTAKGVPKAAFVITMTQPRTRLGRQIDDALNELGIPVLQARTTQRVAYPNAINEGNSVIDGRDQTARNEILAIRGELEGLTHDD